MFSDLKRMIATSVEKAAAVCMLMHTAILFTWHYFK